MTDNAILKSIHTNIAIGVIGISIIIALIGCAMITYLKDIREDIQTITDRIEYVFPAPDTTSDTTTMFKETE